MMNMRIRRMIDEIFADMKMTAENLALRDELLANAQARYEDTVRQGRSEEEAFAQVAASLGDVQSLLREMNEGQESGAPEKETHEGGQADARESGKAEGESGEPAQEEEPAGAKPGCTTDLGQALNKAFNVLGDVGQQIVPQAKKLVRQVDDATGGVIDSIGKAVGKGMRDAQKAAGQVIDKLSGDKGELVFDFGMPQSREGKEEKETKSPAELREEAKDLRAQAEIKQVSGDQEGARELRAQAYALEMQADAAEQELAMKQAQNDAAQETAAAAQEPVIGADGELDEEAFSRAVDQMAQDAEQAAREAAQDAEYTVCDAASGTVMIRRFPAAGLHGIDIGLDADDVEILPADTGEVEVRWETEADGCPEPSVTMEGHKLTVRRRNPDVFKTFFSVFKKEGGRMILRVPCGYAAEYTVSTTSGDIRLMGMDVDSAKINTVSGDVRLEPDARIRAKEISVTTVSGDVTVSACVGDVVVSTVSGNQFISCDANRVDANNVSGRMHVEGACEEWEASSVSGEVELLCTVAPTRKIQIGTMSGSARVALPEDIRGFVAEASGLSTSIVNEFGPNRYGTCALPIRMDTVSGKLMITRL